MAWTAHTIIQNGQAMPFEAARVHPLAVGPAYGAAVFENMAADMDPATARIAVFRMEDHLARLDQGMRFMRFDDPPPRDTLRRALHDVVRANAPDGDCYLRLLIYIESRGSLAATGRVGWICAAVPRERSTSGVAGFAAGVSSWTRMPDNTMPGRIKATANYHALRIASLQARADGYDVPILLTREGKVSETASATIFLVRDGVLVVSPLDSDILESVTRDTVLVLAAEAGLPVQERRFDRSELYLADEAFLCSTGHDVVAITSVDRLPVGDGSPGPVTTRLRRAHADVVRGTSGAHAEWRTPLA